VTSATYLPKRAPVWDNIQATHSSIQAQHPLPEQMVVLGKKSGQGGLPIPLAKRQEERVTEEQRSAASSVPFAADVLGLYWQILYVHINHNTVKG
jgi:hypothetical protein